MTDLRICDETGDGVTVRGRAAESLLALTDQFDEATVSACPACACRVLVALAVVDVLDAAGAHPQAGEIIELADEAPTSHVYLVEIDCACTHRQWRDPGHEEWSDIVHGRGRPAARH